MKLVMTVRLEADKEETREEIIAKLEALEVENVKAAAISYLKHDLDEILQTDSVIRFPAADTWLSLDHEMYKK